jgi:hypothetical protein
MEPVYITGGPGDGFRQTFSDQIWKDALVLNQLNHEHIEYLYKSALKSLSDVARFNGRSLAVERSDRQSRIAFTRDGVTSLLLIGGRKSIRELAREYGDDIIFSTEKVTVRCYAKRFTQVMDQAMLGGQRSLSMPGAVGRAGWRVMRGGNLTDSLLERTRNAFGEIGDLASTTSVKKYTCIQFYAYYDPDPSVVNPDKVREQRYYDQLFADVRSFLTVCEASQCKRFRGRDLLAILPQLEE